MSLNHDELTSGYYFILCFFLNFLKLKKIAEKKGNFIKVFDDNNYMNEIHIIAVTAEMLK